MRQSAGRVYGITIAQFHGSIINQLYELQLRASRPESRGGYEVLREADAASLPAAPFLLVQGAYPGPAAPALPAVVARLQRLGQATVTPVFEVLGVTGDAYLDRDRLDAFFLPFGGLAHVQRPGPNLYLYRVQPAGGGR